MAINKPTIAAGPSIERLKVTDQRIQTHPAGPGESYLTVGENNILNGNVTVDSPSRVGQVFFHVQTNGRNKLAVMYIGVDIGGTLTWAPTSPDSTINGYTGKPIDPIYD